MTGQMVPTQKWGSAYIDQVEIPDQRLACAKCFQASENIIFIDGTTYCPEDARNTNATIHNN